MKILVIVAHPDDEVLGMGGTIKKLTKEGHNIKIVILATGITSRRSPNYSNSTDYKLDKKLENITKKQLKELQKDAKNASKILGVTKLTMMNFPDNEMDKITNLEITKTIEKIINEFKPQIVYTHSEYDLNIDHRIIHNAVLTATRPSQKFTVKKVITFEVPSSTEWNFSKKFIPNIFVDISKELSVKTRAMKAYQNEIRKFPHPRSMEGLEIIAKRWGTVSGFRAAEAFCLIREFTEKF
tara:strand:- start:862 stop:1581 length:720 start_codon:yes stop_codon:yes gene_type:complete